jgi:two-component system KDP operon response regulator KdpE
MSNNKFKVLVIEDDAKIISLITAVLEANSFCIYSAGKCSMGKTLFLSHNPDIVILDLGLPDADGLEFIRFARESSTVPIIILSARSEEHDKVTALDLGANDYVTKPFGTAELMARMRAALRSRRSDSSARQTFTLDDLTIDFDKRQVTLSGEIIPLTQTEYNILAFLSDHAGKVLTYSAIIQAVWGYADTGSTKRLQVNMANIRKKLRIAPGKDGYILNELGVGYRMREPGEL